MSCQIKVIPFGQKKVVFRPFAVTIL